MVFENKVDALKIFKTHKDARFKSFKSRGEALKFAKNGTNPVASILDSILKCKCHLNNVPAYSPARAVNAPQPYRPIKFRDVCKNQHARTNGKISCNFFSSRIFSFAIFCFCFLFPFSAFHFRQHLLATVALTSGCALDNRFLFINTIDFFLVAPPLSQPPMKSLEKSNFPGIKPQQYVAFRKEIEQNNVQKVYEMICTNPRYLVGSGDTPSILKEGPRYNALHVAAMNKHEKMAKLILQTVEQPQFVELLHGIKGGSMDPNVEVMSSNLLKSYLNTPDKSRNETPLHFAAKIGALEVIEVLISYPLCEMMPNFEGLYPKDVSSDCHQFSPFRLFNDFSFTDYLRSYTGHSS